MDKNPNKTPQSDRSTEGMGNQQRNPNLANKEPQNIIHQKYLRAMFFAVGLFVIFLVPIVFLYLNIFNNQKITEIPDIKEVNKEEAMDDEPIETNSKDNLNSEKNDTTEKYINLYYSDSNKKIPIMILDYPYYIAHYNGDLYTIDYVQSNQGNGSYFQVKKYNPENNAFTNVLDTIGLMKKDPINVLPSNIDYDNDDYYQVSDFQIIDGNLYVGLGGYFTLGLIFAVDLNDESPEIELIAKQVLQPEIKKYGDDYYLRTQKADMYRNDTTYNQLDLSTLKLGKTIKTSYDTGNGYLFLGSMDEKFVFANSVIPEEKIIKELENKLGIHNHYLDKIIGIDNDGNENMIYNIPSEYYFYSSVFNNKWKKIFFINSESLYEYLITDNTMRKIADLESKYGKPEYFMWSIDAGGLCIKFDSPEVSDDSKGYHLVDHTTGKVIKMDASECYPGWIEPSELSNNEYYKQEEIKYFESLNLPDNYIYKIEESPIK